MSSLSVSNLLSKAEGLIKKDRLFEAELALMKIVERFPENERAKLRLKTISGIVLSSDNKLNLNQKTQFLNFFRSGNFIKLAELAETFLNRYPNDKEFLELAAAAFFNISKFDNAEVIYRRLVNTNPKSISFYSNLCTVLVKKNKKAEALDFALNAVEIEPNSFQANYNCGLIHLSLRQFDQSINFLKKSVNLDPTSVPALVRLGIALKENGLNKEAKITFESAVKLAPENFTANNNLGLLYQETEQPAEAVKILTKLVAEHPKQWIAHYNLGLALKDLGQVESAITSFENVLSLNSSIYKASWNLALLNNLKGDLKQGFAYYESRFQLGRSDITAPNPQLKWDGNESLVGKKILIYAEQGLGDIIQFSRYLLVLMDKGAEVYFIIESGMHQILKSLSNEITFLEKYPSNEHIDFEAALASLPYLVGTVLNDIPAYPSYLTAPPDKVLEWNKRLCSESFNIGICWQGNVGKIDKGRSFSLNHFQDIGRLPEVNLVSLHKGEGVSQINNVEFPVQSFDSNFDKKDSRFIDTASVIENCDLIITSDTSVAHLAGALGANTWVLLQHIPDWRWLIHGSDCKWYPSLKLYRQDKPGNWQTVFEQVQTDLLRILKAR